MANGNKKHNGELRTCTWVWLIMILLTLVTYFSNTLGVSNLAISLGVLLLALIKGHLVGAYFMELRYVRGFWRWPITLWLLLPGTLISIAFYLTSG